MGRRFDVQRDTIRSAVGSEFIFKGLHRNVQEIKSLEGIDIAWCAEAQATTAESWQVLDPTIRKPGSEIWIDLNPDQESDATYQMFIKNPPPDAVVVKVGWQDNPWWPEVLEKQRQHAFNQANESGDWDAYNWIWEGHCRQVSDAIIFRRRVVVETFDTPVDARFYHGTDWGFANDPTALLRCYIIDNDLYVDREVYGHGVEIDETPALFDTIETARSWPIMADAARPETISYMRRQGFNISAAEKWPGSVEDGVAHLKGFNKIHVHATNCPRLIEEAKLYSYKVDRITGEILPVIIDKHNHGWDALRYALAKFIRARGGVKLWEQLGRRG